MEDESHGNMPSAHNNNNHNNQPESASPESPCLKGNNSHKEQDRFLPIANVGRIMKKVIPANGKISKDAKETVQECVSEFISFVTGEASDKCQREKRKTINGDDIIWAITTLGFEDYVVPLKAYLNKYRDIENEKLNVPKQQRSDQQHHHHNQQQQQHRMLHQQTHHELHDHNNSSSSSTNNNNMGGYNINTNVYSSTSFLSQPSFVGNASDHQPFSLPFSPNSIQKQLQQQQQQDQIDSVAQW